MVVNEPKNKNERGAIENPVENANGEEIFVRLSFLYVIFLFFSSMDGQFETRMTSNREIKRRRKLSRRGLPC